MTKPKQLLEDNIGKKILLLANESIARGVLEAGVRLVALYPGTPSSEIGNNLTFMAPHIPDFYFEFSTNEKVAMEVAGAAAVAGVRSMMVCKGPGLNVAADPFFSLAYVGVRSGMVIVVADDPSMWSSQNENDSRYYALMGNMPLIEPSDPSEAKSMLLQAYEISEKLELPILFRTTTRINHTRSPVTFGPIRERPKKVKFVKEPFRFVPIPSVARIRHPWLLKQIELAMEISESTELNFTTGSGDLGIITSGVSYNYVVEALSILDINAETLKLGMTHPVPEKMISEFLNRHKQVVMIEELNPFLETHARRIAQLNEIKTNILGKEQDFFPRTFEYSPRIVIEALSKILNCNTSINWKVIDQKANEVSELPPRPPLLCAGCPHRATYYAIRAATRGKAIYPSDIGCYTLSIAPPLETADILFDMGSSITTACGLAEVTDQEIVATIGDSTFFASGLPGIANAVYNQHRINLVILDNRTTAMTGHQPHPGTGFTATGDRTKAVSVETVAKALGADFVETVDPYDLNTTIETFERARGFQGLSVVVAKQTCSIIARKSGIKRRPFTVNENCIGCRKCVEFGCPAIEFDEDSARINALCTGCGVCAQICTNNAIEVVE